jgi:glycosyltransferase involved in cell wall biosynthesis
LTDHLSVAVVIPTHNRRTLLMETLESLAGQSRPPDRVVVVADGCVDDTVEALAGRPDITVITSPGLGAAGARNAGWRTLDADVIAFIDDDCRAEPRWLAELVGQFRAPDVGLVQGTTLPAGEVGPYDRTVRVVRQTGLYESCNIAYRRDALEAVAGMRESFGRGFGQRGGDPATGGGSGFGEDTDLAWRVLRSGWRPEFASGAVVRHAVFPGTPKAMVAEAWRTRLFPFLLSEIPELRTYLPGGRWLFRKQSAIAQMAMGGLIGAVGATLVGRRPYPAILTLPYLLWLSRQTRQPRRAADIAVRDAVTSAALVTGSVQHRTLLL